MRRYRLLTFAILLILLIAIGAIGVAWQLTSFPNSYWLWAGITENDAPANANLYVYQGLLTAKNGQTAYQRIGLYPYPIKANVLYLSYRLEGDLPDIVALLEIFQNATSQWQRHRVTITGLQLDFDSPTSKLLIYSDFLSRLRQQLPKQYALSITGLGDWILWGDKKAMTQIGGSVDEIVFQLYQGRRSFPDSKRYVERLRNFPAPFKVGLLANNPYVSFMSLLYLRLNPVFKGLVYFIQK
jgi:Protein of unknown function (DUF3142)